MQPSKRNIEYLYFHFTDCNLNIFILYFQYDDKTIFTVSFIFLNQLIE
jgi:hypothetical protein